MMNFARRFFSRPTALFGFAVFAAIVVIALAAPLIFARGPFTIVGMPLLPPGSPGLLAGSDVLGRDMAVGAGLWRAHLAAGGRHLDPGRDRASACCWARSPAITAGWWMTC